MPACRSYGADRELGNITASEGKVIMSSKWRKLILETILVWIICIVDILWSVHFIYSWRQNGTIISVRDVSTDLGGILGQNIIVSAIAIFLFLLTLICLREQFTEAMYMKISGKRQRNALFICLGVLIVMTFVALVMKEDKITVLYSLLYYTVFVAFTEEFVVRDVCVYLLRAENKWVCYLVPNLLFAGMHLFAYADWGKITLSYVISFVTSQMLGLVVIGCLFQFLKEKSGTIWVPVLVHAILDYSIVLG